MKTTIHFTAVVSACLLILTACTTTQKQNWAPQIERSLDDYAQEMICVTPTYRQAPELCIAPTPSGPRMSQTQLGSPHGQKFYHLYVSDEIAYMDVASGNAPAPIGLTLVKESHFESIGSAIGYERSQCGIAIVPGSISELFVMSKVGDANTPNTDAGWIYSLADSMGEIQLSGLIESCISCHQKAPNDRLFDLAPATTIYREPLLFNNG